MIVEACKEITFIVRIISQGFLLKLSNTKIVA